MTLTTELADPDSPASRFLRDRLPARDAIVTVWREQMSNVEPVMTGVDAGARAAVGGAIEWCIGFDLAETLPYGDALDLIPRDEAQRILRAAGLQPALGQASDTGLGEWRREPSWSPPPSASGLVRDVWMLCQYAGIMRKVRTPDPALWRQFDQQLLATFDDVGLGPDTRQALQALWHSYVTAGRPMLIELGPPNVVRPVFDDAFAVGDLVLGGTLVDVTTHVDPIPSLSAFVDQLLGYVLCDVEDHFAIRSIGIYLAWQARLLQMPLTTAMTLVSGDENFDLPTARRAFAQHIAPAVERSRFYKHGTTAPGGPS